MDSLKLDEICRICMVKQENMSNLINHNVSLEGVERSILEILNSFVDEQVRDEIFPRLICSFCTASAVEAYNFKAKCNRSYRILNDHISRLSKHIYIKSKQEILYIGNEKGLIKIENTSDEHALKDKCPLEQVRKPQADVTDTECKEKIRESSFHEIKAESVPDILSINSCPQDESENTFCRNNNNNNLCNSLSTSNDDLDNEARNLYFCIRCNKSFKSKYILSAHLKRHDYQGQYLCNICGKGFSSKSCLTRHSRVHTGEKKYECTVCQKRFPSSNNLNLHFRTHSGEKPYLCMMCGKTFSHPTGLTYHIRTHTKEKPYSCDVCNKTFMIQCHLDRHKKIHTGERPFPCTKCDKAFIKKSDLQRHDAVHSGLKPHSCTVCNKTFFNKLRVKYHMMLHTQERPHICSACGKGFIRVYYLKDHIAKHHSC